MRYSYCTILTLAFTLGCGTVPSIAQMQPNAGTTVDTVGNRLDIRGTQFSGKNQFNSFQTFNINSGQTANFIPNNINIQNILSRVTGGTPSQIQGVIQSANGVNLFLMNPSGILFSNGASLNVNGSFTATTANAIGFGNNLWFNAAGNNNINALTGDPIQFAFTSNNPGAIVNTGNLTLPANLSLNLIGGTVINTGTLNAPGGNITIAAVEGGKAVQISTPGSILSYTLPTDAISSINPAIGSPASLPELLTGSSLDNASGVEIKDGVVTLVRSQTPLQDRSGLAVISGTIKTDGADNGSIKVSGKTIAVVDSAITTQKTSILVEADRRLVFEDQADNKLLISTFDNSTQAVTFRANATNGIIESIDPNDQISVHGGPLGISASTLKLGNLSRSGSTTKEVGIRIAANNDIQVGNVTSVGSIEILSSNGNIKAGDIRSINIVPTKLIANIGNIELNSLSAGTLDSEIISGTNVKQVLDVFAGGTFRVTGTLGNEYSFSLKNASAPVFDFILAKTGKTFDQIKADNGISPDTTGPRLYIPAPVSIRVTLGSFRIRYAGGADPTNTTIPGLTLQGGNSRFEIGGKRSTLAGDPYKLRDPNKTFNDFVTSPINTDLVENATYQTIVLPKGASGTVGTIVRDVELNGSLSIGLQDQAFGILPKDPKPDPKPDPRPNPKPDPKPETKISTIDLETRNPNTLNTCPQTQKIALAPTESNRSPETPVSQNPSPVSKNPCRPDNNDDEILKILK